MTKIREEIRTLEEMIMRLQDHGLPLKDFPQKIDEKQRSLRFLIGLTG